MFGKLLGLVALKQGFQTFQMFGIERCVGAYRQADTVNGQRVVFTNQR